MPNRNAETLFNELPQVDVSRSRFDLSHDVKTSFNVGQLIPLIEPIEILPGDTFNCKTHSVIRLSTPVTPFMDNLEFSTYWFFVPNRLTWSHWNEMMGENKSAPWTQTYNYQEPQVTAPAGGWTEGTIADYMGIPTKKANISVSALPFRGYCMIYNEWFRDENLSYPLSYSLGDATVAGSNGSTFVTDCAKGGIPVNAAKLGDRFTKCLPEPQKGPDVTLPLGSTAPVYSAANVDNSQYATAVLQFHKTNGAMVDGLHQMAVYKSANKNFGELQMSNDVWSSPPSNLGNIYPSNLMADLSNATAATINQIRLAFQIQKLYERDARGGTRLIELIKSHFGVTSDDARMQRPEYLGGSRIPLVVSQVVQTSESGTTPQGTTGAYSLTVDSNADFQKSFTEHGLLYLLGVARYKHSYQQGLSPMWTRKERLDHFWPVLCNIGEQSVKNREIYCTGTSTDDQVFGYQECWSEYRFRKNYITGQLRSNATGSLDVWHLADNYNSLPFLSDSWIQEDKSNVDRVLTVTSAVSNQIIGDFYMDIDAYRPMPAFSIPGLLDHH